MSKHPMQKISIDTDGVVRFQRNEIVIFLLEQYAPGLNDLRTRFYDDREDYEQLMMLIGYSISGFGELSCADGRRIAAADRKAGRLSGADVNGDER